MPQWLIALAVGGVGYWWYQSQQPAAVPGASKVIQTGQTGVMYNQPIGPGLQGATNVAKIHVTDTMDMPMGTFSRS